MAMNTILGLDIGTTSTIGILIRLPGEVIGIAARPTTLRAPHPGWAEEDPSEWWANVGALCRELLGAADLPHGALAAIGVTGMLPAVVLLDAAGAVLRPSIQQSDGRCGAEVAALRVETDEAAFIARAGNGLNQQLVTAKLRWVQRHEPAVFARIATVQGSYDYIANRLTGARTVERNWALEAGFVDLHDHAIADDLVALAHIPRSAVPRLVVAHEIIGRVTPEAAQETGLPAGVPVIGGAADHIASALGAGITAPGDVLLKFGGSVDVLVATDRIATDPRLYLDYHLVPGLYMPNGCMATGGSGLNWFAREFAAGREAEAAAQGLTLLQWLDGQAAARPAGAEGVLILPYFLGEKTPLHNPAARGVVEGLTLSHDLGHVWRALLEAYAYAIAHHIEVLREMGQAATRYVVSDGGSRSTVWMQIVADVLQAPLQRLTGHPGSCLGAAWTAAMAVGLEAEWSGVTRFVSEAGAVRPDAAAAATYRDGYARFRDLYRKLAPLVVKGDEAAPSS